MNDQEQFEEIEEYGDESIKSGHAKVSKWLILNYIVWPIFGIIWFYLFWNGSTVSWFDRGYWNQLQKAANTTMRSEDR